MASEKTTGEGDGGEVRRLLNNSFSSFVSVFKEHVQTILQAVFQCSSPSKNKTVFHHLFIYLCCVTLYFSVYIMFAMSTFKSPNILPCRHVDGQLRTPRTRGPSVYTVWSPLGGRITRSRISVNEWITGYFGRGSSVYLWMEMLVSW